MTKKFSFRITTLCYIVLSVFEFILKPKYSFLEYSVYFSLGILIIVALWFFISSYKSRNKLSLIKKSGFLINFILSSFIFFVLYPNVGVLLKTAIIIGFSLYLYFMLLSLNVYIVSDQISENLPLLQPSRLVIFMMNILNVFLTANFIYKITIFSELPTLNLTIKFIVLVIYMTFLFFSLDWYFIKEVGDMYKSEIKVLPSLQIYSAYATGTLAFILMFFPFENYGRALLLSAFVYCNISFITAYMSHRFNSNYYLYGLAIMLITYILVVSL